MRTYSVVDFGPDTEAPQQLVHCSDLHANGFYPEAHGGRLVISDAALDFIRDQFTSDEDGFIEDQDGQPVMWVGGFPYPIKPYEGE
jgi:hypothetical protein